MSRIRKFSRSNSTHSEPSMLVDHLSLVEMFERYMAQKRTEGLAKRTISDHELFFEYFLRFTEGDVANEDISYDLIREYIDWMLNVKCLSFAYFMEKKTY